MRERVREREGERVRERESESESKREYERVREREGEREGERQGERERRGQEAPVRTSNLESFLHCLGSTRSFGTEYTPGKSPISAVETSFAIQNTIIIIHRTATDSFI